jgi:hypothetical protein
MHMIVDVSGRVCGFTSVASSRRDHKLDVHFLELYPNVNWQAAMPSLLRGLHKLARQTPTAKADTPPLSELALIFGRTHPAYDVLGEKLAPFYEEPYAWYVRVEDVPGFVRHAAPILEERLVASILWGHSGELIVDFYRGGLRLQFDQGRLAAAEPWRWPGYGNDAQAGCPAPVFLQLLFGYRSLAELRAIYPDVWAEEEAALLINVLFPRQQSTVRMFGYT